MFEWFNYVCIVLFLAMIISLYFLGSALQKYKKKPKNRKNKKLKIEIIDLVIAVIVFGISSIYYGQDIIKKDYNSMQGNVSLIHKEYQGDGFLWERHIEIVDSQTNEIIPLNLYYKDVHSVDVGDEVLVIYSHRTACVVDISVIEKSNDTGIS